MLISNIIQNTQRIIDGVTAPLGQNPL